jgi:Transposase IS116/IS110/IS902 family
MTLTCTDHISAGAAARLLGDVGDISRFPTRGHFASWNGTAPIDASSGDQQRHRLSRAGNRRINRTLHIMAIVQLRNDTKARAYYRRKLAAGKTSMEAMRSLKRRLSDLIYKQMIKMPGRRRRRAREDTRERLCNPARPARSRQPALRNNRFPNPPPTTLKHPSSPALDTEGCHERIVSRRWP